MKARFLILAISILLGLSSNAQTEIWGMTSKGGANNGGVIFKTDSAGNNYQVVYSFEYFNSQLPCGDLLQANNGKMYGMSKEGGFNNNGTLFEYDTLNNTAKVLIHFNGTNGKNPWGSLIQADNGKFYGMTVLGGSNNAGVLFEYDINSNTLIKIIDFDGKNKGTEPLGSLIQASNGNLYGMTVLGGNNNAGVLFEYNINANTFTKKIDFDITNIGAEPYGSLIQANNGKLYGVTRAGGSSGFGVLFEFDIDTDSLVKKVDFDGANKGISPRSSLIQASNGKLYGLTEEGGSFSSGVLFEYDIDTDSFVKKVDFGGTNNGNHPRGSLLQASNGRLYGMTFYGGKDNNGILFEYNISTNTFEKKIDFDNTNTGVHPYGSLIQASNGNLYGLTSHGGNSDDGILFEYSLKTNTLKKKVDFNMSKEGAFPQGSLLKANNGNLYGLTWGGGINNDGVLFEFDIHTNTYTKKIDFDRTSKGEEPCGNLMQADNGNLYGMTLLGGVNNDGVLFEYNILTNTFAKKVDFDRTSKGANPYGTLIQVRNGKLYGMTMAGGSNNYGVLFEYDINTNIVINKYNFDWINSGGSPRGRLLQADNGNLYGLTKSGGANGLGVLFEYNIDTENITNKIDFDGTSNGGDPWGSLIQASNGMLYGMTRGGGNNWEGSLIEYNIKTNTVTKKVDFDGADKGAKTPGSLIQSNNGNLYGMTYEGGSFNKGVLFEYNFNSNTFTKKMDFNDSLGMNPAMTHLILVERTSNQVIDNSQENSNNIEIYPNPANSSFFIQGKGIIEVSIINVNGKQFINKSTKQEIIEIEITNYPAGLYFVLIQTNEGMISKKVMISH